MNHSQYLKYIMDKFCFEYFKLHISFVYLFIFDVGYWSSIFCVHFILLESLNLQNIRKQTPNSKAQQIHLMTVDHKRSFKSFYKYLGLLK